MVSLHSIDAATFPRSLHEAVKWRKKKQLKDYHLNIQCLQWCQDKIIVPQDYLLSFVEDIHELSPIHSKYSPERYTLQEEIVI